jgi:lytic murein transglycosylase
MTTPRSLLCAVAALASLSAVSALALAASPQSSFPVGARDCRNTAPFEKWFADFRAEAQAKGVSKATIALALDGMTMDPSVIARDRRQSFFSQSFLEVAAKLATKNREQSGAANIRKHRALFDKAEQRWGVPASVITAFWALESDFGAGMGKLPVMRSLVTLAYDCRRGAMFREELLAALKIIDRGDLKPAEMIGSWAGELGQTQFLPTHYFNHAVDFDGDGRRDLIRSPADIIASTSAFIASLGWKKGQPWMEEVRVPAEMPWDQADLAIRHPRAKWAGWGVTSPVGGALPRDQLAASLLLPMGRNGPAFLVYDNFRIYLEWNQALTYATTAAYLATRLDGAPVMAKGRGQVAPMSYEQVRDLQQLLKARGFYAGEVDGKLGQGTRASVKAAQLKLQFPADSYPSPELLDRLRAR